MISNLQYSQSPCLPILNVETTGMCHHALLFILIVLPIGCFYNIKYRPLHLFTYLFIFIH